MNRFARFMRSWGFSFFPALPKNSVVLFEWNLGNHARVHLFLFMELLGGENMTRESRPTDIAAPNAHNPPKLVGFLRQLIRSDLAKGQNCRRQYKRHAMRTSLTVQPLTDDFKPEGEAFEAVSSDISFRGMAFVFPDPIEHEYIRIKFNNFDISAIAEVKHNSSIGVDYPLYLVGIEFIEEYYDDAR